MSGALLDRLWRKAEGIIDPFGDTDREVLPRDGWARWLDPKVSDPSDLLAGWDEARGEHLELRPVSTEVNNAEHNGAKLIERAEPVPEAQTLF